MFVTKLVTKKTAANCLMIFCWCSPGLVLGVQKSVTEGTCEGMLYKVNKASAEAVFQALWVCPM